MSAMESSEDEIEALLRSVGERAALDLRDRARAPLMLRLRRRCAAEGVSSVPALLSRALGDPACLERLLPALGRPETSIFRHPRWYRAVREHVVPLLRTYPHVRIWWPGCATGREVYGLAIVLREEGLLPRAAIYATDASEALLAQAARGAYPPAALGDGEVEYQATGGRATLREYAGEEGGAVVMRPLLRERITFAQHSLSSDASFNEFHLIVCRDVMLDLRPALQEHVFRLLHDSLGRLGVLALGRGESLRLHPHGECYTPLIPEEKLFRRVR